MNCKAIRLRNIDCAGFAMGSAEAGQPIKVLVSGIFTSDEPEFHIYAIQIDQIIGKQLSIPLSLINKALIIIHKDKTADAYLNGFSEIFQARVNRDIQAGEAAFASDVDSIISVEFPDILINNSDKIIYIDRMHWRFGIYFDFRGNAKDELWKKKIAELKSNLLLKDFLSESKNMLSKLRYPLVFTEGKTDWRHLKRAATALGRSDIAFHELEDDRGDEELWRLCKASSSHHPSKPWVFLFDRDNAKIVKAIEESDIDRRGFASFGNNIYALLLPKPSHRLSRDLIFIELFYCDEDLSLRDDKGRRLFFDNEIQKIVVKNEIQKYKIVRPIRKYENTKKIFEDNIRLTGKDGHCVALSKAEFAEYIYNKVPPFSKIRFDNFKIIFDSIDKIVDHSNHQ